MKPPIPNILLASIPTFAIFLWFFSAHGSAVLIPSLLFMMASASLLGVFAVDVLRGKLSIFDPMGILGFFGYVYFLVAPLLQIMADYWPNLPLSKYDLKWVILWAILNFIGVVILFASFNIGTKNVHSPATVVWVAKPKRFYDVAFFLLGIGFVMQIYVYQQFGGIAGFINTFTMRQSVGARNYDPFDGFGVPMFFSDGFKYIFAMTWIYRYRRSKWARKWSVFFIYMLIMLIVALLFGGLRGSRSSTVYTLFFAAGLYHFFIRPLTVKIMVLGVVFIFLFMNTYYWYKFAGNDGIRAMFDVKAREDFGKDRENSNLYVLTRDFSRMDVQILILREIFTDGGLQPVWGRTYLTSIYSIVPDALLPNKPPSITKEKTELIFGRGRYDPHAPRQTTMLLGQFGEMLINWHLFGGIWYFWLLGRFCNYIRHALYGWHPRDLRRMLLPMLSIFPILTLMNDANLMVMLFFRVLGLPVMLLILACTKIYIKTSSTASYRKHRFPMTTSNALPLLRTKRGVSSL